VEKLLADRRQTLEAFRDPHRSPYAAVERRDFSGSAPLVLGSSPDSDLILEGARPHHARIRVDGESFLLEALDDGATVDVAPGGPTRKARLPPGARLSIGRYAIRLSHQNFPALVLLDPQSPRLREGPLPRWFEPAADFRVVARLEREAAPRDEVVLSTRGNMRRARRLGRFSFTVAGKKAYLVALRLLEPGVDEADLSIFFRDATTGKETYPVGRYLEPEPVAGTSDAYVLDFNRAYNPACAFSPHYNCPIPPRENVLGVAVRAGERDPGH
ncbi:MAG TPA: DUF1684 domain-containing protein, partial [Thermoanaerobaculia bacterium]